MGDKLPLISVRKLSRFVTQVKNTDKIRLAVIDESPASVADVFCPKLKIGFILFDATSELQKEKATFISELPLLKEKLEKALKKYKIIVLICMLFPKNTCESSKNGHLLSNCYLMMDLIEMSSARIEIIPCNDNPLQTCIDWLLETPIVPDFSANVNVIELLQNSVNLSTGECFALFDAFQTLEFMSQGTFEQFMECGLSSKNAKKLVELFN